MQSEHKALIGKMRKGFVMGFNVIISHRADLDGMVSAALMAKRLNRPLLIYLKDYDDEEEVIPSEILGCNCDVYISDISISQPKIGLIAERIKKIRGKVLWIDHHLYRPEEAKLLNDAGVDLYIDKSAPAAALLVSKKLGIDDALVEFAMQSDTWNIRDEKVFKLVELIDYLNYLEKDIREKPRLRSLPLILATADPNKLPTDDMLAVVNYYERLKDEAVKETLAMAKTFSVDGVDVAISYARSIISGTIAADAVQKAVDADIYIIIKDNGAMSFRRARGSTINLVPLAQVFGGGGHEEASGASLKINVPRERFYEIAESVIERIKPLLA